MSAMVRLKQLKDLELYYDALAAVTVEVYTDVSSLGVQGPLALVTTLTFPLTVGRQTYTLPLDDVYGTLVQLKASSAGRVILFGGVLRVKDIGTYFFGNHGEVWDSGPLSVGIAA